MNSENTFKLIEGTFSAADAKEIILTLVEEKIQFHKRRCLSHELRLGTKDDPSLKRINALKEMQEKLQEVFEKAEQNNHMLVINAAIDIEPKP